MKQILQDLKEGEVLLADIPVPEVKAGHVLIASTYSLVSLGTEKSLLAFGQSNWIERAKAHPDKVKKVIDKAKTDGVFSAYQAVKSRLDDPLPLGYSNVGRVVKTGKGVTRFKAGDRVVSNGPHAEVVCVPENLCAAVPEAVDDQTAAFTVVAAIGLQGIRLMKAELGETVVVLGLGLVGLLSVQILKAHGCQVIGFDFDEEKVALANKLGARAWALADDGDPVGQVLSVTKGVGADGVLITTATQSSEPVQWAPRMCRKRGRVVLVGVSGLELSRSDFYEKEISFQVSCSYGPGRYDPNYEKKGLDYPIGFVRWTEQRNLEAILSLMAERRLVAEDLVTDIVPLEKSADMYRELGERKSALGLVIKYPGPDLTQKSVILKSGISKVTGAPVIGVIGAGRFAGSVLLPGLQKSHCRLKTIVSPGGLNGWNLGKKFLFENAGTEAETVLNDDEINAVVITTPHESHARLALEALRRGKNVFVEKPLAITLIELQDLEEFFQGQKSPPLLLTGFNRRFSPHTRKMRELLKDRHQPFSAVYTVNAGAVPPEHWVHDPAVGGGRLIGEACHFVDLLRYLAGAPVKKSHGTFASADTFTLQMEFEDGSIGTVHYFSNGHGSYPKETLEVFSEGRILRLHNFLKLEGFGWPSFKGFRTLLQDKGHREEMDAFITAVATGSTARLIPLHEMFEVTRLCLDLIAEK